MGLQSMTNGLVWLFTAAAIFTVALRLLARLHLTKAAGWDDGVIVIALMINVLSACLASYAVSQGVGLPLHSLPQRQAIDAAKWGAIADASALMSFTVPKLSVAILLTRILSVLVNTKTKRFLLMLPAIMSITWSVANEGFWFGQCSPTAALWDKTIPDSWCLDPFYFMAQGIALCAFSAAADIFYGLFPILFVTRLNMSRSKKIHLSLMLGLGVIGGAVAIWKTTQFIGISVPDADVTDASAHLIYATLIEANLLVVAACVPTVPPVVRAWRAKVGHTRSAVSNLSRTLRPRSEKLSTRRRRRLAAADVDDDDDSTRVLAGIIGMAEVEGAGGAAEGDRPRGRGGFPAWRDYVGGDEEAALGRAVSVRREVEVTVTHERVGVEATDGDDDGAARPHAMVETRRERADANEKA